MTKRILAAAAALLLAVPAAHAHAFLDRAVPAVGSTVKAPPASLDLFFTEGVVPHFSQVGVAVNGRPVAVGRLHSGRTARELIVPLPKLPPGDVAVTWHATSVDTHKTQGGFHFTVAP